MKPIATPKINYVDDAVTRLNTGSFVNDLEAGLDCNSSLNQDRCSIGYMLLRDIYCKSGLKGIEDFINVFVHPTSGFLHQSIHGVEYAWSAKPELQNVVKESVDEMNAEMVSRSRSSRFLRMKAPTTTVNYAVQYASHVLELYLYPEKFQGRGAGR